MSEPRVSWVRARTGALRRAKVGHTIADLARLGVTPQAIGNAKRWGNIGFSPPLQPNDLSQLRTARPRGPNILPTRPCLCCRRPFGSEGPHNRLCDPCREKGASPFEP